MRITYGVMGMLARCRDPRPVRPGVEAALEAPSSEFVLLFELEKTSLRNWSLFMADPQSDPKIRG